MNGVLGLREHSRVLRRRNDRDGPGTLGVCARNYAAAKVTPDLLESSEAATLFGSIVCGDDPAKAS